MPLTLDQLFPQSGQPTQSTPGLTLDELFPPVSTVQLEPVIEEKPESGFWAHIKKSFADAKDYLTITALGADGAEGNEEEIARIVAETSRRQHEVAKSAQHQYLLDVISRESKDVKDAEGFADTSLAVLDAAGKTIWTAVTNPLGVAEFGASQAGNMAVAVGGMFAGGLAGIPGGPAGIAIGSRLGALSGGASVETGAAYIEALMKAGVDVTDQVAVQRAISDPEFQREMYKKGFTKGLTIGIVDAAFMGLSKMPGTKAGRELRKDLLQEGIDIKKNADWEKIAVRHAEGDEAVTAAFKKYAEAPRAKAIGTKRMTIETIGEGVGEGLGGLAAFGETSFEDIALEMLGSTAQSAVQASVSASLSGSKQLLQKATKEALRQQADSVAKGEASDIEPEELNESLRRQKEGVGAQLDTVSATISAFEDGIGESDNAQSVIDTLRTALTLEGFANYRLNLQSALQTEDTYPNGVMPFYVALTKEEQATLAAGGSLPAPVKGSLNRANVKTLKGKTDKKGENFGGQDVVLVKVPVSSVIMRGNWDKLELVVEAKGMQLAAVPQAPQQTETKPVLSEKLEQEADRLAREDVETTLQTEVEIGELEAQAIDRSKKDVDLDTREATDKAARKLAQLREPDNYETVAQLQGAVDRNKVPLFPGQRRKRPPLALALQNYRKALEKPDNINALNDVLAPTGYKLSKKADGIHVVPIDNKPALRVPNTGNREVGQSTVDDYLFWINEEQTKKAPETTEKKQAALKKEAAQVEARKPPRENVQSIIDSIEKNFVTRKGNKVTIDEEGLSDILAQAKNIAGWSKADRGRLDQYVRSLRKEQELQTPTKKAPVAGTTITVPQSAGALTSLESSFKRTGKSKFIERVRKLLTNKKGNDALLAEIAKAYRKANPGKAEGDLASILTLTGKADQANIAKAYALAQMLITLRPSVSTIRPDNTLAIEDGNLSAFMRFDKVLDGVKENQLVGQIKQVFGEDSTYTRINDFEVVVTNPKLTPIQFARRFGRLRGKRNDIKKSELFTAQIETHTHDWAKDPSGESIRSEIRRLGFGSILQYVDDRRADYLDIAEEFGAKEVAQYRQAPRAPPQETTAEETEAADEAAFSLEGQAIVFSRKIENKKEPMGFVPDQAEYRKYPKESGLAKGILVKMTPQEFLNLVPNRTEDSNVEAILDRLEQGDRMAPPFLNVEITKNGLQITGHEGRGRMIAATSLGLTDEIEVDVFFNRDRVEDFDAIDPKPVFISQTGRADIDTVEPQVTVPLRRLEDTSLDKADESVAFSLAETTKVYPGEYELTASDGTKYKVVQAEPEETFGPGREWKLYRATKENPDYHADFDWDWMDTFPRLKDAKAWVEDRTAEGPLFALGERKKRRIGEGKDTEDKTTRHLEDLEKTIPVSERTARASTGKRTTVDGGAYLDLDLTQQGQGMLGLTQEDLNKVWEDSVDGTINSEAARQIIAKLKMAPKDLAFWDAALKLPDRARYWYEVSAESFESILHISKDDMKRFIAIVSATSPQANPMLNMKRAMGVFSQYLSGRPIDMDLIMPGPVEEALRYGELSGLKTGSFAGTMQYIIGLDSKAPLSTNDRQVASSFGIGGNDIANNPILYETLSRFYINLRDTLNAQLPPGAELFETWQLQALGWVEERATSNKTDSTRESTDDYLAALQSTNEGKGRGVLPILKDAGVLNKDYLTAKDLKEIDVATVLSNVVAEYRKKQKVTMEIGSPFSDVQLEAASLFAEALKSDPVAVRAYLSTFTSVLRKAGLGKNDLLSVLSHAVMGGTVKESALSRIVSPTSAAPYDFSGTYEGVVSPNLRIPLPLSMTGKQKQLFMAVLGKAWKQDSVAHSRFAEEGDIETRSVFVNTSEQLGETSEVFSQFANALPEGYGVTIEKVPNGYILNVLPKFLPDDSVESISQLALEEAVTDAFAEYTTAEVPGWFTGDLVSNRVNEKTDPLWSNYDKIISEFRSDLLQTIAEGGKDAAQGNVKGRSVRVLESEARKARKRLDNFDSALREAEKLQQEFEQKQTKWVEKYRKRLSPEAASLTPIDKPASGGFSASGLRRALVSKFGEKGIARLEADGILVIVESAADLPAGLIKDQDAAQRARGLFDPKTNTAYLIANRLNRLTASKVLLHEVGTHFGLKRMLGDTAYADLIVELEAGKDTTFKPWYDRVRANYGGRVNEGTDRFAEEVLAAIAEDTSEITLPLRTRIWRAIKKFLFGVGLPKNLTPKEIGYVIQGSLRKAMRQNDLALAKMPRFMRMEGGDVQLGAAAIAFPEYTQPTRKLTEKHKRYDIISAIDKVLNRSEELRLRRNMDGMMKVAERVYKKGYKNIDVHLPVVSPNTSITSRYAMFKNTQTGTELVIRMSDHPKDPFVAAGSFPFVSYNNGHKTDMTDLSDIERAVKLLSAGKLDGMNGLQFQFEYSLGDGVAGISKANSQKFTYEQFLRGLQKKNPSMFNRVQDNAQMELRSGAVIGEEGPVFSLNRNSGLDEASKAAIAKTSGRAGRRSAGEMVSDARNRWWQKRVQNWVDAYRPIKNLLGDQATRAWQMMQLSENAHGMLHAMLHYGAPKARYHNGEFDWYDVDFSREGLLDILKDLDGEADRFMSWMVYTRANRLAKEEREKNFTTEEIVAGLKLNQQSKNDMMKSGRDRRVVYQKAMRKMSKLQDSVLQMAVDAGVIDETVRETLDTDFYVPFYREFTSEGKTAVRGPTPSHDFVNIKSIVNRLRGSEENINDALQSMMMNWTTIMSAAMKNRAGVAAMEAATKAGVATLIASKKDIANIEFSKGKSRNEKFDSFVYVLKDGKKVWYEVNDPLVLNAMASLVWGGVDSKALRTLSTFKRWLTIGVTASPAFKIRNLIRDTVHSIAVGKLSYNALGNASTGYQTLKDNHLVTANMMMGGATFQFGFYNDDPAAIRRMVDAVGEGRILDTTAKARKAMGFLFNWYQDIGNRMENANRASLYLQRKEEVGHLQASMEGRDLLNFSQHGRGVAAQWLMASMPFLQARINGLDKLARSGAKGERARMLTVVGTVTLASILLRLSYEGDEDYEELEEWQKDTYWPIKIPDTKDFFFLPKPFEIGAIASMGERITENFIRDAGELGMNDYTRARITDALMHQLAVDWRPQIVKPMVELWQNKNSFTDRQIENITWQMNNLPKELRVRAYTSDFSIKSSWAVGEMLDLIGLKESGLHISPVQMDHLIKGYFGWIGATTTGAFDVLSSDVDPLTRLDEMRGLLPAGSFYSGSPRKSTKYLTLFYDQMGEVKGLKAAFDAYKRRRMVDEARAVVSDNKDVMRWLRTYNKANEAMQKINKRIGFIYDDKDMSPADKRKEIDRLNEMKVGIAKKIVLRRAEREAEEGIESDNPLASLRAEN